MGTGLHGGFGKTKGSIVAGDIVFTSSPVAYFNNISNRTDKDPNGYFDFVAHGSINAVQISHNGIDILVSSRVATKLIKTNNNYHSQPIRLLSCDTGSSTQGFAQNLANKLNVVVEAPTKLVWARSDGTYFVAGRSKTNPNLPNLNDKGKFVKFYPGGNRK